MEIGKPNRKNMSYRQWLIGQVFYGVCGKSLKTKLSPDEIASWGLAIVNAIEGAEETTNELPV